jgi:tetratricopeptide (TPR) repeat protein
VNVVDEVDETDARDDLAEQRDFLLRSIEDLDREFEAGDLDEADYRALRDDYTTRAADVLRAMEGTGTPAPAAPPPRRLPRVLWVVGVVTLAIGAGWLVATSAGERVAGDAASGSIPEASTDRIARAQRLVREGDVLEAVKVYDELLDDDPENPVALAERGWLISRVDPSLVDSGLASIEKAIELDPRYAEAHFYRGMILLQSKNDAAAAAQAFETALASDPPPDLKSFLEDALQRAEEGST